MASYHITAVTFIILVVVNLVRVHGKAICIHQLPIQKIVFEKQKCLSMSTIFTSLQIRYERRRLFYQQKKKMLKKCYKIMQVNTASNKMFCSQLTVVVFQACCSQGNVVATRCIKYLNHKLISDPRTQPTELNQIGRNYNSKTFSKFHFVTVRRNLLVYNAHY